MRKKDEGRERGGRGKRCGQRKGNMERGERKRDKRRKREGNRRMREEIGSREERHQEAMHVTPTS